MEHANSTSPTVAAEGPNYEIEDDGQPALKRPRTSFAEPATSRHAPRDGSISDGSVLSVGQGIPIESPDYPRRRAIIACEVCRSRKSRCDGNKPKCKLCTELKADCVYREPGVKLDAGDRLILERLTHIEGLLQSSLVRPPTANLGPISPATSNTASEVLVPTAPMTGMGISFPANISAMPKAHTTPALHLLQWPVIRDLVSKQCDPQILMQLEMTRPSLNMQVPYALDLSDPVPTYVKAFFDKVNVWYAVVNPCSWQRDYHAALAAGFHSGAESCMVLLVLALGEAAYAGRSISTIDSDQPVPGMGYFNAAWSTIFPTLMIQNSVASAQCHILAAAYLIYLVRPLEAWNLLSSASMKLQLLLSSPTTIPPTMKELSERIYWNTLLLESDLLAELDLPHSGITSFEETMRLPRSFPPTNDPHPEDPPGSDDLWYFLAEIALRRLLNRVSHTIYAHTKRLPSLATLEPLVSELDYQLTQWYTNLPPQIRFPHDQQPSTQIQTVLRLRYYACRTIIYRPYVQAVLSSNHEPLTSDVKAACERCLDACLRQLENVQAHHEGHLPYLWQGALSITSQTLLLMGTTLSPILSELLPPKRHVDAVIAEVVSEVERLGRLAPSLKLCGEIIREAEDRRQVLMQRPR